MSNKPQVYQPTANLQLSEDIYSTSIKDLYYINSKKFQDERGFFCEVLRTTSLEKILNKEISIKQVNYAYSQRNVIRGLHGEGWNKLVTILSGHIFCALVDVRQDSPTFRQIEYFELKFDANSDSNTFLYIPKGVANSYLVLEGPCGYIYGVDQVYEKRDKAGDVALSVFDTELDIQWPIPQEQMIISQRDKESISFKELIELKNS